MFYVSSHLGEHVQERVSVGVDDRGDVRDAVVHVGPHHLHLLVKVGLGVGRLDLLVHPLPHELGLSLDKLLVEDVGSGDEVSQLQNGDRHPAWLHLARIGGNKLFRFGSSLLYFLRFSATLQEQDG